jgi:hypothetical protein
MGNVPRDEADAFIKSLEVYSPGAVFQVGAPQATVPYTPTQLAEQGYVGIYRL